MTDFLTSPIFWQSMGFTVASGIFISPVFYNGDYGKPVRAAIVLGICSFFTLLCLSSVQQEGLLTTISIITIINVMFMIGLYLGVYIYNQLYYKEISIRKEYKKDGDFVAGELRCKDSKLDEKL